MSHDLVRWPVHGHEWAVEVLQRVLSTGQLAHAYCFVGSPGIGKATLARATARGLVCSGAKPPCGQCSACRRAAGGNHPDVRLLVAEGRDGREFVIEQTRSVVHEAALAPLESQRKVFILREFERANANAANALLKTLEEPPRHVVFILTATDRALLLPTVLSRCQVLPLRPLPITQVEELLVQEWQTESEQARLLARLSGGRLGWAVRARDDTVMWQRREQRLDEIELLAEGTRGQRLEYAERLGGDTGAVDEMLSLWMSWWRDLLLVQSGRKDQILNVDREAQLELQASRFYTAQIRTFLRELMTTAAHLQTNVNVRLALEVLLLRLPRPQTA